MSGHTPGPWHFTVDSEIGVTSASSDKGGLVAVRGETTEQAVADFHLIAAAPDLLEALQLLSREELGDFIYDIRERELEGWEGPRVKNWSDACMKAAAAIKRATGEVVRI